MRPNHLENSPQTDLFRSRLDNINNMRHELVKLAQAIDWEFLEDKNAAFYATEGRPGVKARLMIGLQLLKQMYNLSDEGVCERWIQDPYFQYFGGEDYFQHDFPMERSSMTHWRTRVGDAFCEVLAQMSLSTAHKTGALRIKDVAKVVVETTVQEKAITFPTDAKLYYKALLTLGKLA